MRKLYQQWLTPVGRGVGKRLRLTRARWVCTLRLAMQKRINVMLPEATLAVIDRLADKGSRSRFICNAVEYYVGSESRKNLRQRLRQEAIENASRDLEMAAEWFPLEEEAWESASKGAGNPIRRQQ